MPISSPLSSMSQVRVQRDFGSTGRAHHPTHEEVIDHFGRPLSEDTREDMISTVQKMELDGATHEEIKEYVISSLNEAGVRLPHQHEKSVHSSARVDLKPHRKDVVQELGSSLSESLRTELMSLLEALKAEGSSFDDVKSVVDSKLKEHGIDIPPPPGSLINVIA